MVAVESALCCLFSSSHSQHMYDVLSNLSDVCAVEPGYKRGLSGTSSLVSYFVVSFISLFNRTRPVVLRLNREKIIKFQLNTT